MAAQIYYKIQPQADPRKFDVNKLSEDFDLMESYTVTLATPRAFCTCPSYKRPCKHVGYVQRFVAMGSPKNAFLNPLSNEFEDALSDFSQEE